LLRSRIAKTTLAAAVLAIGAAGVGAAAIPGADGKINACYDVNGQIRLIDLSASGGTAPVTCTASEKPLTWNQKGVQGAQGVQGPAGPKGAPGATGPKGPAGPQGPAGPSFVRGHFRVSTDIHVGETWKTLAMVDIPKGLYSVQGKAGAFMEEILGEEFWAAVTCRLYVSTPSDDDPVLDKATIEISDNGPEYASMPLMGLHHTPGLGETVKLQCKDDGGPGGANTTLRNVKLMVQQVGGWTATAN
jgi:hypothetical protein